MIGRTLFLAAMAILGAVWLAPPARAQNLDAGKPPGQIFSNTCNACHKSARGLLRTVSPGSLPGFLRQHYTTSSDMAKTLSVYVLANGATDTRVANVPVNRQGRPDAQPGNPQGNLQSAPNQPAADAPKPPRPAQQQAARSDADGLTPTAEPKPRATQQAARTPAAAPDNAKPVGRNVKRGAELPTPEAQAAALAAREQAAAKPANTEAAIVAAIPLPESADLPPPTIGDFKVPTMAPAATIPSDAGSSAVPSAVASVPPQPAAPSPSPPPTPLQSRSSSASLQAGGPPAPPISH